MQKSVNLTTLQPLKGSCQGFFHEVKKVTRPYIPITEEQHKTLESGQADYYQMPDGSVVTFGNADGGWALMPLQPEFARTILQNQ